MIPELSTMYSYSSQTNVLQFYTNRDFSGIITLRVFGFVGIYILKHVFRFPMVYTHRFRGALSTITATATRASNNEISLIRSLISETISFGRAATFLEYFFALHLTSTWNFLMRRCLKDINTWWQIFLFLSKLWCGPQEINFRKIHLHFPFLVRCNKPAKKYEKTNRRIHFSITVMFTLPSPQSLLKRPMLMNEFPLVLPQTRTIAGVKVSWLVRRIVYSTKYCGFKRNRIKSTHVRFRIQNHQRLDQMKTFLFRNQESACKWKNQSGT